jgi:hypothetical protein
VGEGSIFERCAVFREHPADEKRSRPPLRHWSRLRAIGQSTRSEINLLNVSLGHLSPPGLITTVAGGGRSI